MQLGTDIDGEYDDYQAGRSVSLAGDGGTVAVGALLNGYFGRVRIYQYSGTDWQQLGGDIDGEAERDGRDISVSLSKNGSTVAIGASNNSGNYFGDSRAGNVRIYQYIDNSWQQVGADIDGEALSDSGWSVSLSADGNAVAIGAPASYGNEDGSTRVRIYDLTQEP